MLSLAIRTLLLGLAFVLLARAPVAQGPAVESGAFLLEFELPGDFAHWFYQNRWRDDIQPDTSSVLATIHGAPDSTASPLGVLRATTHRRYRYLDVAIEYQPHRGAPIPWDLVGDTGYGFYTATWRRAGSWALLPANVFGGDAWVHVQRPQKDRSLRGSITSVQGYLIAVDPLLAAEFDTEGESQSTATYFVVAADSTSVVLRPELPSDMQHCKEDVLPDPPASEIPIFRLPTLALFGPHGEPRFFIAYAVGC